MADEKINIDPEQPLRSFRRAIGNPAQDVMASAIGIGSGTYGSSERSGSGARLATVIRAMRAHGYRLVMMAEKMPASEEGTS